MDNLVGCQAGFEHNPLFNREDMHFLQVWRIIILMSVQTINKPNTRVPGQVHVKGGRRREQGALLVARCASSTCLDEAQKIAGLDHPVESRPQPRVSRFSHMVDVHTPDFFALGLA